VALNSEIAERLLADLDEEQRIVATSVRGPVLVIAGAGTGKTRAITYRIAYGVASGAFDPMKTLALTFTAKAAGEMRSRLRTLGIPQVSARTFHSAALRQLLYFWPEVLGGKFPQLLTTKSGFLREAANRIAIAGSTAIKTTPTTLREIAGEIEWCKSSSLAPDQYLDAAERMGRKISIPYGDVARVYESYESLKRDERAIDFEDVLLLTIGMLEEESAVINRIREQYRFFTVDEYQDVSPLQQRLLDIWLGTRKDICVVGDPAQTIYSFAGASPAFLLNFTKKYPDAQVIRLQRGYRSTQEIINTANHLVRSSGFGMELIAGEISHGNPPRLIPASKTTEELDAIITAIKAEISAGRDDREIAILVRTNNQIDIVEKALAEAGLRFQVKEKDKFFDRPEVLDAMRIIRSASVLSESAHLWPQELAQLLAPLGDNPYLQAIKDLSLISRSEGVDSLRGFLRELEERKDEENPPQLPGITLATIHAAKGLEWPSVYLAMLSKDSMPWPTSPIDEERRLFYVAITRAKERLVLSYSGVASPFLDEIGQISL
jgi:DNA helicase-2/ATP-dependent DNA helicase PcrA